MKPLSERKLLINSNNTDLSVAKQCELLQINRTSLYYTPSPESDDNLTIMRLLDEAYMDNPYYGVRKLVVIFVLKGYRVNIKRMRRLMKIQGWRTLYCMPHTTKIDPTKYKYPYLLKDYSYEKKNQVWSIDITYIPMKKGFMYLFAIIDVYSRYIVNWGVSNSMTAEWCASVIKDAMATHGKPEIMNSDQGSQFTSDVYINLLKENNIKISMDGKGRAIDNIYIERFWRSIKYEDIYLKMYENGTDLYDGINVYIQKYNEERPHQSLNYDTPKKWYNNAA